MTAILFMQIRWSLFIYQLFEPLAALNMFALCTTNDVFMYNQSTLLITSLLSQSHFKNKKIKLPKANLHIN